MDLDALDRHIVFGRSYAEAVALQCEECDWTGDGIAEKDMGAWTFDPEECPDCGGQIAET